MRYLYGDSSESPFHSNFLEFLRDAVDFAVYVLDADQRIAATRRRADGERQRGDAELAELDALRQAVNATLESSAQRSTSPAVADCASKMIAACAEAAVGSIESAQQRLAAELARAEAEEEEERSGCHKALLTLLTGHVPPSSSSVIRLQFRDTGNYEVVREGAWPGIGLNYKCQLAVPMGHRFSHLLRVESFQHRLEIAAPEQSGWLKKEVKTRPQHLERHVMTGAVVDGTKIVLHLRTEPGRELGFDVECDLDTNHVSAAVVSELEQLVSGPFDVRTEDAAKLLELCRAVHDSLAELKITLLSEAELGDSEFRTVPKFYDVAERLIRYLSPFVHEIAKHSLEPDELVLRRQLGNDRREEIFVSKLTLRQKYEHLPASLADLFAALQLHAALSRSLAPVAGSDSQAPVTRSELSPSNRPPAGQPLAPVTPGALRAPPSFETSDSQPPGHPEVHVEVELAPTLEKVTALQNAGQHEDAFRECIRLLAPDRFAEYEPSQQRQALNLLLSLKMPGGASYVTRRAHRAGRDRAKALVQRFGDPADHELLGLCHVALGESAEAIESFRQGLQIEHSRDPKSSLCERLAMHTSGLVTGAGAVSGSR